MPLSVAVAIRRRHGVAVVARGLAVRQAGSVCHGLAPSSPLNRWHSTTAAEAEAPSPPSSSQSHPELTRIPSLPYVGSMLPFHSGIPTDPRQPYSFWPEMRRRFGEFYEMGFPVMGDPNDKYCSVYVIHDPNEMIKVVRSEGRHPSGLIQRMWPNNRYLRAHDFVTTQGQDKGFSGQGPGWKRLRGFLQTDLLHPEAARGYIPGMVEAARSASRGAPASNGDLIPYFNRCAFDLFSSIMFGEQTRTADPNGPKVQENLDFVRAASGGMAASFKQLANPYELIVGKALGFETDLYRTMSAGYETTWSISRAKIERFLALKREGKLDEEQAASYLARAIERQASEENVGGENVTLREMEELVFAGLFAAVDTTSSTLAWTLLHLALNPAVQEKLHAELSANLASLGDEETDDDGTRRLNSAVLDRSASPYLQAVVRESHRLTPIGGFSVFKRVGAEGGMELHGAHLPKGAVVALCAYPLMIDPEIVDDPTQFLPERWYPDAVAQRRGTPSEIIDHPYFKDAFSQGPRKCPAARVATNEILVMIAQLVLDYRIAAPEGVKALEDVGYELQTTTQPIMPALRFERRRAQP